MGEYRDLYQAGGPACVFNGVVTSLEQLRLDLT